MSEQRITEITTEIIRLEDAINELVTADHWSNSHAYCDNTVFLVQDWRVELRAAKWGYQIVSGEKFGSASIFEFAGLDHHSATHDDADTALRIALCKWKIGQLRIERTKLEVAMLEAQRADQRAFEQRLAASAADAFLVTALLAICLLPVVSYVFFG